MKPLADNPRFFKVVLPLLVGFAVLALWHALVVAFEVPKYLVPSPVLVAQTLVSDWHLLYSSLLVTLKITFLAFFAAVVIGTAVAFLFVQSRWIEASLFPYAVLLQVTPVVAIAPLIIIWVKNPTAALTLCATLVALFPIIANTTLGLRSVNPGLLSLFRMNRATRLQTLVRLRIPSALPYFFGGLRISSGLALIGAVVAEFVAGTGGTGAGLAYQILQAGFQINIPRLFQSMLKGVPSGINASLAEGLVAVTARYRGKFDAEALEVAATVGIAELLLSGCTTVADHHYLYYPDIPFDGARILFDVAERLGVRFVLCRGGMTRPQPGFEADIPPQLRPESVDSIIQDVSGLVQRYHDADPLSMRRVVMAPTTPTYRVRPEELVEMARAARRLGVRLHTHLSENLDYLRYFREVHDRSPVEFCADHEWIGPDVWFAHLCHTTDDEIELMARNRTGIAHCPASNCRLGSGIAQAPKMAAAGMPVSLAVDGAASNESADMLSEAHLAWLVHRAAKGIGRFEGGADAVTAEQVIHWGTHGGAAILGIHTGAIEVGRAADIAVYSLDEARYMGLHDPGIGPVVGAGRPHLRCLMVGGRIVVRDDRIPGLDMGALAARSNAVLTRLTQ